MDKFTSARDRRMEIDEARLAERGFNYYQALGVASDASSRQIREAYQNTVRMASPSKLNQSTSAYFRYLNEALDVLTNEAMREAYDESLGDISSFVSRRFSPASVAFPELGEGGNWIEPGDLKILPKPFNKFAGIVSGAIAAIGFGISAWVLPYADMWAASGWAGMVALAVLYLYLHPSVKSPMFSVPWLGYGLGFYLFTSLVIGNMQGAPLWAVLLTGIAITFGFAGVGEWWRSKAVRQAKAQGMLLDEEYLLKHKELGTAGESWRWMARKSKVSSANLTQETFTQQMTADILMRLSAAPGVRILHGVDIGSFIPHLVIAGNKIAVIEGIIVEGVNHTFTARGILECENPGAEPESVLTSVPAGVAALETFKRGLKVRGWVLVIPHHGGALKIKDKGNSSVVKVGTAHEVLQEVSRFLSEDNSKDVIDLQLINALWSRKTSEK